MVSIHVRNYPHICFCHFHFGFLCFALSAQIGSEWYCQYWFAGSVAQ